MAKKKASSMISDKVKALHAKLEQDPGGKTFTRGERSLEVTREEAAYLLSVKARREITTEYLRQLTRGEKPRLRPYRATGNTYTYQVEALLNVDFTSPHKRGQSRAQDA